MSYLTQVDLYSLGNFHALEQWMLQRIFTAYPFAGHPLKHSGYQVGAVVDVPLRIVLVWEDLTEVTSR